MNHLLECFEVEQTTVLQHSPRQVQSVDKNKYLCSNLYKQFNTQKADSQIIDISFLVFPCPFFLK